MDGCKLLRNHRSNAGNHQNPEQAAQTSLGLISASRSVSLLSARTGCPRRSHFGASQTQSPSRENSNRAERGAEKPFPRDMGTSTYTWGKIQVSNVSETIKGTVQILAQGRADFWRTWIKAMGLDQGQEDNSKEDEETSRSRRCGNLGKLTSSPHFTSSPSGEPCCGHGCVNKQTRPGMHTTQRKSKDKSHFSSISTPEYKQKLSAVSWNVRIPP